MSDTGHIMMFGGSVAGVLLITGLLTTIPVVKKHRSKFLLSVVVTLVILYGGFIAYNWAIKYPDSNFKDIWNPFDLLKNSPPRENDDDDDDSSDGVSGERPRLAPHGDKPLNDTLQCEFVTASSAYSYKTDELIPQPTEGENDPVTGQQITKPFDFKDLCVECDQYVYKDDNGKCVQYEYDLKQNEIDKESVTNQGVCTVGLEMSVECNKLPTV